jgi:methionine aminotransferase
VAAKIAQLWRESRCRQRSDHHPGATQAIFCAIQAVIHSGDEVIVFDPCYDSYEPSVELAGGAACMCS